MSEFEECKVLLGERAGCLYTDRIYLPISPTMLGDLVRIYEELSIKETSYWERGMLREAKDFYQNALDQWRRMRDEFDKYNEEKEKKEKT